MKQSKDVKKKRTVHVWTDDEKQYLREITPGHSHYEILELMNSKFEYQFTHQQIKGAIARYRLNTGRTGYFEKGHIPYNKGTKGLSKPNKTSFKKGCKPINLKPVGSERVNIYGYTEVKVAEPNKWQLKHRVLWEKHHGKIPNDKVVLFADGDKTNLSIDNLLLATKKQLFALNRHGLIQNDAELTKTSINLANLIIKLEEMKQL